MKIKGLNSFLFGVIFFSISCNKNEISDKKLTEIFEVIANENFILKPYLKKSHNLISDHTFISFTDSSFFIREFWTNQHYRIFKDTIFFKVESCFTNKGCLVLNRQQKEIYLYKLDDEIKYEFEKYKEFKYDKTKYITNVNLQNSIDTFNVSIKYYVYKINNVTKDSVVIDGYNPDGSHKRTSTIRFDENEKISQVKNFRINDKNEMELISSVEHQNQIVKIRDVVYDFNKNIITDPSNHDTSNIYFIEKINPQDIKQIEFIYGNSGKTYKVKDKYYDLISSNLSAPEFYNINPYKYCHFEVYTKRDNKKYYYDDYVFEKDTTKLYLSDLKGIKGVLKIEKYYRNDLESVFLGKEIDKFLENNDPINILRVHFLNGEMQEYKFKNIFFQDANKVVWRHKLQFKIIDNEVKVRDH